MRFQKFNLNKKIRILSIFAGVSFLVLGFLVRFHPPSRFDSYVSKELQAEVDEERAIDYKQPLTWVSVFGNGAVAPLSVVIIAILFWFAGKPREAQFVTLVFVCDALNLLIKTIVNRPRPTENVVKVLQKFQDSSFPSGHVVHYVVLFGFVLVAVLYRRIFSLSLRIFVGLILLVLILTIPISRIYLGAHWATDVIGGYLVGFVFLSVILGFYFVEAES